MSREIVEAMRALASEKGINPDRLIAALEDALLAAYKKQPDSAKYARVVLDPETGEYRVIELIVPERLEAQLIVETIDEGTFLDPETGEYVEPQEPEIDPEKFKLYADQIDERDVTPDDFGRIAAQTAKQVILQRIREAERDMMYEEYRDRVGELVTGIVQQSDSRYTLVQLRERVEALLPRSEQVDGERYDHGQRVKAVIKDVSNEAKGPAIVLSRRDPELIKSLFELEVPEIADGLVEIANVAREPGYRSKIAVVSYADGVDPVGACVGPRGSRVRMVVSELRGEKIDIIPYNDEPARFVAKALSPARVREVLVDDDQRQATVIVPDDQLSLAIGREGQNARLAARLTGWRIDIRSETEFATDAPDSSYDEEETGGRCAAIQSTGRRCPNAALPGLGLLRPAGPPGAVALLRQLRLLHPGIRRAGDRAPVGSRPLAGGRRRPRRTGRGGVRRRSGRGTGRTGGRRRGGRREPRGGGGRRRRTHGRRGGRGAARITARAHAPQRRCVGCGQVRAQSGLIRLALDGDRVAVDQRTAPPRTRRLRLRRGLRGSGRTAPIPAARLPALGSHP